VIRPCAVGFDFDRTLGIDNSLERRAFSQLAAELGTPISLEEQIHYQAIEALLVPFRDDTMPMAEMIGLFAQSIAPSKAISDTNAEALAERWRQICFSMVDDSVQAIPGAKACIAGLVAEGVPVGILTNGWSPLQERKIARALGVFPGPIIVSGAVSAYKPSAKAFQALESALGCDPADLWYVGDNPITDITGALAYGLRAIWFNSDAAAFPDDLPKPTAVIRDLAELPALVRGL
jgi:HAD superfamily hydrolase (TIGR01549 family)